MLFQIVVDMRGDERERGDINSVSVYCTVWEAAEVRVLLNAPLW